MASLKHYLMLGGKYGLVSLLVAAMLYVLCVRRPWEKRELPKNTRVKWFLTLWYVCALLLVVFAGRSPFIQATNFHPFEALREALVSSDRHAAIQLALNVLSFVPLGLLLVWHAQGWKKGRRLYALALLVPLGIEAAQYLTRLGTLDLDDLLANSLGALWGISLGSLYVSLRARKKTAGAFALLSALPLLILALGLGWLAARPYGFVRQVFPDHTHAKPQQVSTQALEGQLPVSVTVYRLVSPPVSEAEPTSDRLFAALGLSRRTDFSDEYDDLAVYWAEGSNEYLWYYYTGDFDLFIPNGLPVEGTPAESALRLLARAGFALPDPSETEDKGAAWHFVPADGLLYEGALRVETRDDSLIQIQMRLHALKPGINCAALDAEALRNALLQGRFSILEGSREEHLESLVCQSAELTWAIDGKGCYHPLLQINCLMDGEPSTILAPAF